MEFRTKIPIPAKEPKINHASKVMLLGSCFVENMGEKLDYHKFQTLRNPFGILFHPTAIAGFLSRVKEQKTFTEEDIFFHNERWHCFEAHSALSHPEKEELLLKINAAVQESFTFLESATHLIITLGTAWGYKLRTTGQRVANCHKVPQKEFEKELIQVQPALVQVVELVQIINPNINIIFTVSPVRHLKDGFVENQQSKAQLITGVHETIATTQNTQYFPSYEIMMDDLRDYRFYSSDMIHPNSTAINYIWEGFVEAYMTPTTVQTMEEVEQLQKGLAHRAFNEQSEAHQKFLQKLQQKKEILIKKFPHMKF